LIAVDLILVVLVCTVTVEEPSAEWEGLSALYVAVWVVLSASELEPVVNGVSVAVEGAEAFAGVVSAFTRIRRLKIVRVEITGESADLPMRKNQLSNDGFGSNKRSGLRTIGSRTAHLKISHV
jgi:hypothetical protein